MRDIPDDILRPFLIAHEGRRKIVYLDDAGIATWGIGHKDPKAHVGDTKTDAQIEAAYEGDTLNAAHCIYAGVRDPAVQALSKHQYAALLAFAFNTGAPSDSTVWKLVTAGKLDQVPGEMAQWDHAHVNGMVVVVHGLDMRRQAEIELWNTQD
jgi:lysozyme